MSFGIEAFGGLAVLVLVTLKFEVVFRWSARAINRPTSPQIIAISITTKISTRVKPGLSLSNPNMLIFIPIGILL